MLLDDAINLVCCEICLQVHSVMESALQPVAVSPGAISEGDLASWLVEGTHFFTLIKTDARTLAFCHANKTLFYARPDFALAPSTPDGHAFLAQVVEDRENDLLVPRLLVLDLVAPVFADPRARNAILRGCAHHFPPTCVLQWVGQPSALRPFVESGLPHRVDGLVALGAPLALTHERLKPAKK